MRPGYVHRDMECNEKFLREMFASPYGDTVGQALVERLEHGMTVTVVATDGSRLHLNDHAEAEKLLKDKFGWRPAPPASSASDPKA